MRLGAPERAAGRLPAGSVLARHADALARGDGAALDRAAEALAERGFLLYAAEARAQAVRARTGIRAPRGCPGPGPSPWPAAARGPAPRR
ncbi:hypothetical protein GCM10017687_77720 [Streptomyces echinatus]